MNTRRSQRMRLLALLAVLVMLATACGGDRARVLPEMRDDFNGTSLDPTRWTPYDNGDATNGGRWYASQLSVRDGVLTIEGEGDRLGALCWCGSGTPDYAFGDYEFRVRVDAGNGYVPAVLLWPDTGDWPADGEIDVLEVANGDRQIGTATLHWAAQPGTREDAQSNEKHAHDFTQWTTVHLQWRKDSIVIRYDGYQVMRRLDPVMIPQRSMHPALQLDLAVPNANFGQARDAKTPQPLRFQIDYVRFLPVPGVSVERGQVSPMGR